VVKDCTVEAIKSINQIAIFIFVLTAGASGPGRECLREILVYFSLFFKLIKLGSGDEAKSTTVRS
jgi:hypothetical protein